MPIRYAVAGGIAVVAAAVGAFLFIPQHKILATNTSTRMAALIPVGTRKPHCERIHSVPSGAGYVRLGVVAAPTGPAIAARRNFSSFGTVAGVRVLIADDRGRIGSGSRSRFPSGRVDVPLQRPTRTARNPHICVFNLGHRIISLAGEWKAPRSGTAGPKLAVTFLAADRSVWLSDAGTIVRRFGYAHAGAVGTWALWFALALMVGATGLAFRLIVVRARRA